MTTGLFSTRAVTSQGIGARAHQRSKRAGTMDAFAERLSEHGDIQRAARECEISASYGRLLFARIKKKLGRQAQ